MQGLDGNCGKADKLPKLCECGCGEPVTMRRRRFVQGHNSRLHFLSRLYKERQGEVADKCWEGKDLVTHKMCPRCKIVKPRSEFGYRARRPYTQSRCRPCERDYQREYSQGPGAAVRRESSRKCSFYVEHGIREEDYLELLQKQNGDCAICGGKQTCKNSLRLFIDHCSKTKEIRGILCARCNTGIGYLLHDPGLLRQAAHYVETARTGKFSKSRRGSRGGKALKDKPTEVE